MNSQELADLVATRANAALEFFNSVKNELQPLVDSLCDLSKEHDRLGRVYLKIKLEEKDKDPHASYRHLDFSNEIGHGFLTANGAEAGEFRVCVQYNYAQKPGKNILWYLPEGNAASPRAVAEYIVEQLVAPTDKQFE
jgi:hypothetical protein